MSTILVKFLNQPVIKLSINDTTVGHRYVNLVKANYLEQFPIYRDVLKYNLNYMNILARRAKKVLGWDWVRDTYTIETTALLHKNIEELLCDGFKSIPEEYDDLVHELHFCLHQIQDGQQHTTRTAWIQIEWFNDNGFSLDYDYEFSLSMQPGDVKLQNPWVGHGPLQLYLEQDFTNISQTCKFHDFVRPGINIVLNDFKKFTGSDLLIDTIAKHDPAFIALHGVDKIKHYIGYPLVGKVVNLNDYLQVMSAPVLELEWLDFSE